MPKNVYLETFINSTDANRASHDYHHNLDILAISCKTYVYFDTLNK